MQILTVGMLVEDEEGRVREKSAEGFRRQHFRRRDQNLMSFRVLHSSSQSGRYGGAESRRRTIFSSPSNFCISGADAVMYERLARRTAGRASNALAPLRRSALPLSQSMDASSIASEAEGVAGMDAQPRQPMEPLVCQHGKHGRTGR